MEEGEDRAYSRAVAAAGSAAASRRMPQLGTIAELEPDPDCSAIYDGMKEIVQICCIILISLPFFISNPLGYQSNISKIWKNIKFHEPSLPTIQCLAQRVEEISEN